MRDLIRQLWQRILDGPRCPDCTHDQAIHGETGCLGAVYNDHTGHDSWCPCERTYGGKS